MPVEETRAAAWQAALKQGDDQLDRGEAIVYSPEILENITRSALNAMHSGQALDPDILS